MTNAIIICTNETVMGINNGTESTYKAAQLEYVRFLNQNLVKEMTLTMYVGYNLWTEIQE